MKECVYCGSTIEITRDHIIPVSYTSTQRNYGIGSIVPACKECNNLLRDNMYLTIPARAAYLLKRYKSIYRSLIISPHWSQDELEELGPVLKKEIELQLKKKEWLLKRLQWLLSHI